MKKGEAEKCRSSEEGRSKEVQGRKVKKCRSSEEGRSKEVQKGSAVKKGEERINAKEKG